MISRRKKLLLLIIIIIPILSIFMIYAFFNSYWHSFFSSNNSYSLPDPTLYDKNTCFSPNDKLVDINNNNWTHVFENAKDSLVKVAVSNPYMDNPEINTGFIYDNDGHIVTNYHVVNNANSINVTFTDGNSYPVQITGTDPYSDLAVVQPSAAALKKEQMKPLPITNSSALQVSYECMYWCLLLQTKFFSVTRLSTRVIQLIDSEKECVF